MALHLDLEPGDSVRIGSSTVTMERKSGQRARLSIDSQDDIQTYKAGSKMPPARHLARPAPSQERPTPQDSAERKPVLRRAPLPA